MSTIDLKTTLVEAKKGDEAASELLIGYYSPFIKSVVNKFITNYKIKSDTQDITQDAKLLFLEFIQKYDPDLSNFGYYLKINFERNFKDRFAKFYASNEATLSIDDFEIEDGQNIFERINIINDLASAINKLPNKQKIAVKLYYFARLPQSECANLMDIKQSAFSRILSRAHGNIKKYLKQ